MSNRRLVLIAACVAVLAGACRSQPFDFPLGYDASAVDAARDATTPPDLSSFCGSICDARQAASEGQGWCFSSMEEGFTDCAGYCIRHVSAFSAMQLQRLRGCIATNPLCFESIEDCMARP